MSQIDFGWIFYGVTMNLRFGLSEKVGEKWTLNFQIPRFGVLVVKYSSYNAVFLQHSFSQAQKTALKEEWVPV